MTALHERPRYGYKIFNRSPKNPMEPVVALLLFFALLLFVAPIWAIVAAIGAKREAFQNSERLKTLELRFEALLRKLPKTDQASSAPSPPPLTPVGEPAAVAAVPPVPPPPFPVASPRTP